MDGAYTSKSLGGAYVLEIQSNMLRPVDTKTAEGLKKKSGT
jgi:hypothetical protein